jgi:hypothetical protein
MATSVPGDVLPALGGDHGAGLRADLRAQARLIIDHAAHPDARDRLAQEAAAMGLASARRWQEGLQEPHAAGCAPA